MRKKRVLLHSNFCGSKSGFGRHERAILSYLFNTGKYDLYEYATGMHWSDPRTKMVPWKCYGAIPDDESELTYIKNPDGTINEGARRMVQYGYHNIDKVIKEVKPDVYIGVEDIWAFNGYWDRKWWNKTNCVIHTTLDSLPILKTAIEAAPKIKNYLVWAKFAEEALHKLGHKHVKTVHGCIDTKYFNRLSDDRRKILRETNNIPLDAFIIGFVFRNQPRKSVDKLLQAFRDFLAKKPQSNPYLLLHTHWEEGWNIPDYIKEFGIPNERVLTTYVCRHCHNYEIKPFIHRDADCKYCGTKADMRFVNAPVQERNRKGQLTTSTVYGVTEEQLNEVYNFMDVYAHPFNSGGQEIPIQEAKLTELITLVTNYSCGTEYCTSESGGMPLEWSENRENESQFIKAVTSHHSITKRLEKVYVMSKEERLTMGKIARQFVLNNCSVEVVGKQYEELIDSLPEIEWDFDFKEPEKNTKYPMPEEGDNLTWLKDLYKNILLMNVEDNDPGVAYWLSEFERGVPRQNIYSYFIDTARKENAKNEISDLNSLFDKDDLGKRIMYVMPESIGDCFISTALFASIKKLYPDYNLYVATKPQYFNIFDANPYVHKVIPFVSIMESEMAMTGHGDNTGYVQVLYLPHISTQRHLNYLSKDKIDLDLK